MANLFAEEGFIDHDKAGVSAEEAELLVAAFSLHVERTVLADHGLTMEQWLESVDEADEPAFRRAVMAGDWGLIHGHAAQVAALRKQHGL